MCKKREWSGASDKQKQFLSLIFITYISFVHGCINTSYENLYHTPLTWFYIRNDLKLVASNKLQYLQRRMKLNCFVYPFFPVPFIVTASTYYRLFHRHTINNKFDIQTVSVLIQLACLPFLHCISLYAEFVCDYIGTIMWRQFHLFKWDVSAFVNRIHGFLVFLWFLGMVKLKV